MLDYHFAAIVGEAIVGEAIVGEAIVGEAIVSGAHGVSIKRAAR